MDAEFVAVAIILVAVPTVNPVAFPVRSVAAPENPTVEDTRPVKFAVVPCNVPARVTPPAALIPVVKFASELNVDIVLTFKLPPTIFVAVLGATPIVTPPNNEILSLEFPPTTKVVVAPPPLLRPTFIILFPPKEVALAMFKVRPDDCVFAILSVVAFALNNEAEVEVVVISPPFTAISSLKVAPDAEIPVVKD